MSTSTSGRFNESQLLVSKWHDQIGNPTLAHNILDRMAHNVHRIAMRGESMRKQWSAEPTD